MLHTAPDMPWSLSRSLLLQILEARCSDRFVCERIWERLGYQPAEPQWSAGPDTPSEWADAFPEAPELIAERPASVRLTRSVPKEHKQLLKQQLNFAGYRIGELYPPPPPPAPRRELAVGLAGPAERAPAGAGALGPELPPPADPVQGHPGDLPVK